MECHTVEAIQNERFETWAIVEIMGRQRYAGLVTEQTLAGATMLRIDIPETAKQTSFTKLFGSGSIHSLTPTTEAIARGLAERLNQAPIEPYDLPKAMQPQQRIASGMYEEDDEPYDREMDEDL